MKAATVKQLKDELKLKDPEELVTLCLSMAKFKKDTKELLSYLLFEADNEDGYIADLKVEVTEQFQEINVSSYYFMKKSVRKILRNLKKYIRYSKKKTTEIELLMHFCAEMRNLSPSFEYNTVLTNTFNRQISIIEKRLTEIHEDLKYDYEQELNTLI